MSVELDMHFYGDTSASPEGGMLLQLVSRRSRYSNFRQGLAWHSESRGTLSLFPSLFLSHREQFDRDLFLGLLAARTRARRAVLLLFSIYRHRQASRRGWRHIQRGKPRTEAARGAEAHHVAMDSNFCQDFFIIKKPGAITREEKVAWKKNFFFF